MNQFDHLQAKLGIRFHRQQLLKQAFTHSSYVNEHGAKMQSNERLEFLGDAVLELIISEYLYRTYSSWSEGELTKLRARIVCEPSLHQLAEGIGFGDFVLLGKGEELMGGRTRPALLADVFEAFIGALYLDQGIESAVAFMETYIIPNLPQQTEPQDWKSKLQLNVQRRHLGSLEYRIVDEQGLAHDKRFIAEVYVNDQVMGRGSGRSKKEAEQDAAAQALKKNLDIGEI